MITLKAEYKGYEIRNCGFASGYSIHKDGEQVGRNKRSLDDCDKWIEAQDKKSFKRVNVLAEEAYGRCNGYLPAVATSATDDGRVWVSHGAKRQLLHVSSVILDTPEARQSLESAKEIHAKAVELEKKEGEIIKAIPRITVEMMLDDKKGAEAK